MGHSVEVVDRSRPRPASVTINTKKMGSGVDSVADTLGNINNAYGKFIVSAADVRKFYDSRLAKDHTNSRISELSMAALYGSGLPMLPSGKIDLECSNHNTTTGTMLIRTEHMKQASHSEESRAWMANFETTQNDSGTGTGNEKEGWQTTRGLKGMTYVRMFGAPVILIAGNRQDDAFPPSTLGGGRIQSLCSSVLDTVGRFKVSDSSMGVAESVSTGKRDRGNAFYQAFVDGRPVKRPVGTDLWDVLEAAESRDTVPMREITVNLVENNVRFFFLRHLWRKALPFVHRAMTLGVVHSSYGHFSTFDNMTLSVRGLTEGLRRNYLIEHTAFKRNIQGPWQTVSAFSTFAMQITEWCTARAIRCAIDRLDLYKAFQDTVMAFLHVPMTFSAKLSSLHSWLFTNVLDVSSMVLFAYVMYITGFRTHCPMDVLALAARGLSMTPEQKEKYDAFCKAHMHLVTPPVQGMSSAMALSGVRSTRVGVLRPVSADQLVKWFNWEANSDGMAAAKENRACTGASVFVQPSMQFVSRAPAEWAKAAKGEGRDEFTAGSSQRMLAHAYALEQRLCAHEERVRAGHILAPYHFPHVFWEAAHKGTRLPRPDKETGNMDRYELVFEPVWETGHWFCQTITRLGNCSGLMKHFLVLCQLDERTTLTEFVIAIFGPYFEQHARERSDVKFHTGGEWDKPILECTDIFEWGCLPFMRNKRVEGVEVMLCMRLAYYIVAQGLVCSGWKPTAGGYSVLVHLRNMAYMSLELLMLFLHTRVEKTCIPASAGRILLPQRSPAGTGVPATVRFDERLHVDSVPCVDAVLCMRARKEWIVAACDPPYLKYKTCDQGSSGEPFLFPPESVMHMQTHFVMMQRALECLSIDVLQTNPGNCMALAMRQYGLHTSAEMFSFVPVTLTHCVVADAREIPCVTFADGYLFVLTYEACKVCLSPVSMTHSWSIDDGVIPGELFERLPIAKTVRFNPLMLGDVMAHGIQRQSDGSYIVNPRANGEALPAYFFPVVHWPCLVCINLERSVVACKVSVEDMGEDFSTDEVDEVDVQIMEVGEYLQMYAGRTLSACETDAWILENADIERDWFEDMYMRDDVITFTVEIEGSTMVALGKNNLKYLKQNTPLQWEWVHPSHVFYYDDRALPLRRTASGIVAEIYHYENTAYEKCARDISTEKKAIVSLDDTIGRLQREARAVDTLVAARMERKCTLERLCEQLGECKISASLLRTLRVGDEVKTKQVAFPPMAQPCDTIGLVQPHPGTSHYLKDGRYYVTTFHAAKNEKDATVLDFVTMSRCMVREGAQMWIRIDADLLSDLNMLGFTLPNSEVATEVLAEETMAQLSAFYVLGGTVEGEHVRKAKVHMFVHILGHGLRRIPFRVFDSEGNEKITPYKSSLHEFDELVLLDECVLDVNIE